MNEVEIYTSIRAEIVTNHILMHWFSLIIMIIILAGVSVIENRKTILSVFLPLLTVAWAASMVRFDFFIHRQNAYLRAVESELRSKGTVIPLWDSWKQQLTATPFVVPMMDIFICLAIVVPTLYILFVPAQKYFQDSGWKGTKIYAWGISLLIIILLCSLTLIPQIAGMR